MRTFSVSVSVNTSSKGELPEGLVWDFTIEAATAVDAVDQARRSFRAPATNSLRKDLKMGGRQGYFASHDDVIPALVS